MEGKTDIFLSYSRKDVGEVNCLYERLKKRGFSPWQDHRDILGGQKWLDAIIQAIRNSSFFLACLSRETVEKQTGVLIREINEALDLLKFKRLTHIYIIPVRLEECEIPEELSDHQCIDLFRPDGFDKLVDALMHGLKQLGFSSPYRLRSEPFEQLTPAEAGQMIKDRNFYSYYHWKGEGVQHDYRLIDNKINKTIIDYTTGLMWQQAGVLIPWKEANDYIPSLNENQFGGYRGWQWHSFKSK